MMQLLITGAELTVAAASETLAWAAPAADLTASDACAAVPFADATASSGPVTSLFFACRVVG